VTGSVLIRTLPSSSTTVAITVCLPRDRLFNSIIRPLLLLVDSPSSPSTFKTIEWLGWSAGCSERCTVTLPSLARTPWSLVGLVMENPAYATVASPCVAAAAVYVCSGTGGRLMVCAGVTSTRSAPGPGWSEK
jgi:hypothetical protein